MNANQGDWKLDHTTPPLNFRMSRYTVKSVRQAFSQKRRFLSVWIITEKSSDRSF